MDVNASRTLHFAIEEAVTKLRETLSNYDDQSYFCIKIRAVGRVHDGEVKISYELADSEYGSHAVVGGGLNAVLEESIRRHNWRSTNAPLSLSYAPETVSDSGAEIITTI